MGLLPCLDVTANHKHLLTDFLSSHSSREAGHPLHCAVQNQNLDQNSELSDQIKGDHSSLSEDKLESILEGEYSLSFSYKIDWSSGQEDSPFWSATW